MPSRLELAPLPSARDNEETVGCWLKSPLEKHIENCRGSSTTGIADPFTVPTQEGQSHLSWHHYGPSRSLSSCPLKRHISTRLCTTNSALIVQTQEGQSHLSFPHYGPRKSLSSCPLKRHISTRRCTTNNALIVPTQEGQSHLSWHHYGPCKSLSSCPFKRHISTHHCTSNSALIVPTQKPY